ncbi:hypothetical protein Nhal_3088 [Nitrosococcus halophilus Nc 4]|uniref:Uncharacterized protein n=1 Tax=Nitrosococcus halophilus (strain Nc4) TaxID=472759 RepID=D5BZC6_NITHN|nr:hypothetical protein [Nitrosococcus halophilus]ADE16140.1 hypothetical protein Nhal_3088 [Nitrosococcus halophilus Nc 4]
MAFHSKIIILWGFVSIIGGAANAQASSSLALSNNNTQANAAMSYNVVFKTPGALATPSDEFRPGLQIPTGQAGQYTPLYFVTSASITGGGDGANQPIFIETNLVPGQNNTGYFDITVYSSDLKPANGSTGMKALKADDGPQPQQIRRRHYNGKLMAATTDLRVGANAQIPLSLPFTDKTPDTTIHFGELLLEDSQDRQQ